MNEANFKLIADWPSMGILPIDMGLRILHIGGGDDDASFLACCALCACVVRHDTSRGDLVRTSKKTLEKASKEGKQVSKQAAR